VFVSSQPERVVQNGPLVQLYRSTSAWHSVVGICETESQKAALRAVASTDWGAPETLRARSRRTRTELVFQLEEDLIVGALYPTGRKAQTQLPSLCMWARIGA